jgi:hypothetical protein
MDDVTGEHETRREVLARHLEALDAGLLEQPDVPRGDPAARLDDRLALGVLDVEGSRRRPSAAPG